MSEQARPEEGRQLTEEDGTEPLPKRFGKYTLLRKLAVGGMAELFLALHRSVAGFEKLVVIKRILPSVTHDQAFIDMLLREARIAAKLSHPNVVQIYDVGFAEGRYYIAMEHIHGEDIRAIIRQMKRKSIHAFPLEHALTIAQGVCAGLAYAHEQRGLDGQPLQIVHRDISPQNILVTYTGDIKIVDFGIAKAGSHVSEDTRSGKLKGKVPYMSPEQAQGEAIDWRSDIFSTGIVLFELTTGKRLFKAKSELETMRLICDRTYPKPSQLVPGYPPRLEMIVMKALEKDVDRRYQSARDMQSDLDAYVRDERVEASTLKLRAWMESLFAERLERQKGALQDLKKLADLIASETLDEGTDGVGSLSGAGASSATVGGGSRGRGRREHSWVGVIVALLVGMAMAVGVLLWWRGNRKPRTGAHTVRAVTSGKSAKRLFGRVRIETTPPGAAVWVDGQMYPGKTPVTVVDLPRNSPVTIKLTKEGLLPKRKKFVLDAKEPNQTWKVDMRLGTFGVTIRCNVPGARVVVDDKVVGERGKVDGLSVGQKHRVVVAARGYLTQVRFVEGEADETKSVSVNLVKAAKGTSAGNKSGDVNKGESAESKKPKGSGRLNVGSRGGFCNVSIRGRSYGPTPVGGIVLPAGSYVVVCKPSEGSAKSRSVTIQPDHTSRISFQLGG